MFCPEERFPRELYWAGFGFQVWCQMLTFIVRSRNASLLLIDEPDIYLHSDLQRQLVALLRELQSDVLLATHSTEIISEADPGELLIINKRAQSAKKISDPAQLQNVFDALGSNLNPTLTQLAKTRRAVFVEGKDFQILAGFARKLGKHAVANRADFVVIPAEGFNPERVSDLAKGVELTLGTKIRKAVIFDRDYRPDKEVARVQEELGRFASLTHIHKRKELENYLLEATAVDRAIERQVQEHNKRSDHKVQCNERAEALFDALSAPMKHRVSAQFLARRQSHEKVGSPALDQTTITQKLLEEFEAIWADWKKRRDMIPGKEFLSIMNQHLQRHYGVTLTPTAIINAIQPEEVPEEIRELIQALDRFRTDTA